MNRHMISSFVLICLSGLILAGCTTKDPSTTVDAQIEQQSQKSSSYSISGSTVKETTPTEPTQLEKGRMPENSIKQLADFAPIEGNSVTLTTTKGDITFDLFREEAPIATLNFLTLAKSGFYDGIVFHRVIADFMAQVGDPTTKTPGTESRWGTGGPGYTIPDEFASTLKHDSKGIVSMANTGQPSTGGSQFFITFEPTPWLDGKHTIFGKVTQGLDVLDSIEMGDKITAVTIR